MAIKRGGCDSHERSLPFLCHNRTKYFNPHPPRGRMTNISYHKIGEKSIKIFEIPIDILSHMEYSMYR